MVLARPLRRGVASSSWEWPQVNLFPLRLTRESKRKQWREMPAIYVILGVIVLGVVILLFRKDARDTKRRLAEEGPTVTEGAKRTLTIFIAGPAIAAVIAIVGFLLRR